jgi:hypothetical protein
VSAVNFVALAIPNRVSRRSVGRLPGRRTCGQLDESLAVSRQEDDAREVPFFGEALRSP